MDECIFCKIVAKIAPAYIVYEDTDYLAFLDKFPQSRGHLQFIPKKHYQWLYEIPEMGEFFTVAGHIIRVIIPALGVDHVTIASFGRQVAHAHLWIVPQYQQNNVVEEGLGLKTGKEALDEVAHVIKDALLKTPA